MTFDRSAVPKLAHKTRLQTEAQRGETLLLYPERGLALNPSAAAALRLCDGRRTVGEVIAALDTSFEGLPGVIAQDTGALFEELRALRLLDFSKGER